MTLDELLAKSAPELDGLNPVVRGYAEALIRRCFVKGIKIRITQGYRSIAEQNELYAQGRTKPGNVVTNAKGGSSFHNYGVAIDFVLVESGYDMQADKNKNRKADWMEVATEAKVLGFEWGGDWFSFKDYPHFEMTFGLTISEYRAGKRPSASALATAKAKLENLEEEETLEKVEVYVDGKKISDGFLTKDGVSYVPARAVSESLGRKVSWDKAKMRVTISEK